MLGSYGWGDDQFGCLVSLWNKESGWNYQAYNRSSGAYGIPQALPGSKMGSAGADWQTNPATQIAWGLGYISGRYGSPCGAWAHSQSDRLVLIRMPGAGRLAPALGSRCSGAAGHLHPQRHQALTPNRRRHGVA